jgi:hypothetical protein
MRKCLQNDDFELNFRKISPEKVCPLALGTIEEYERVSRRDNTYMKL